MPRKIVINRCFGGFSLSQQVKEMYMEATQIIPKAKNFYISDIPRDDPELIKIIELLGLKESSGHFAKLKIIEIPDEIPADGWTIQDYDGIEWVAEKHRTWSGENDEDEQEGGGQTRATTITTICAPETGDETITADIAVLVKPDLQEDELLETKE